MKTDLSPVIVEIIDDDDAIPDRASIPPRQHHIAGSRWAGPTVAVTLLVVAGYGAVSSFIWPSPPNPAQPANPALITPQYYVADPPAGFMLYTAEARGEPGANPADFAGQGQAELWATPGASATTGAWFVVKLGEQQSSGRNSYRMIIDGTEVIFEHDPASGQTRLSFVKDGHPMAITSFGWVDRQLIRLVRSVNVDESAIRFSDGFFASDHRRMLASDPTSALFGLPAARVGYTTGLPLELAENFTITVAGDDVARQPLVAAFALTKTTTFDVGEVPAIVGQSSADPSITIAQWHDGDRLVSIHGNLDASRIEAIAQTVHESPSDEVHQQLGAATPPVVTALRTDPHTVAAGMLSDGWRWAIQVSPRNPDDPTAGYLWWIGQPHDSTTTSEARPSQPGDAPSIEPFVEHGRTYVLARIPRSMEGASLHIAPTDLPSIVTEFHDIDPSLPTEFAASVFTQPVPFTARILDDNGRIVAFWPML